MIRPAWLKDFWAILIISLLSALAAAVVAVHAHGGRPHGPGGEFTNLEALKKATQLYDKLIETNKLEMDWETGLERVQVSERRKGIETEKVVSFSRGAGEPATVYLFFSPRGEYAGSNFTGK
jgi:hypothetical protein